jgi:hypothetical protein
VIRNVVIHMQGEQPLLADIEALPTPTDACVVCTNMRMSNGKRPTFVDRIDNWFLIPLLHIRFVEIPADALPGAENRPVETAIVPVEEPEELEVDEEFLRKIREA